MRQSGTSQMQPKETRPGGMWSPSGPEIVSVRLQSAGATHSKRQTSLQKKVPLMCTQASQPACRHGLGILDVLWPCWGRSLVHLLLAECTPSHIVQS